MKNKILNHFKVTVPDELITQEKGKRATLSPKAIGYEARIEKRSTTHKCDSMLEYNNRVFSHIKNAISDSFLKFASPLMIKE